MGSGVYFTRAGASLWLWQPATSSTPTITWPAPASIVYGTPLSAAQLDATASVPGTFAYSPAAGTVLKAGNDTLSVTFTPTDSTDYTTATASRYPHRDAGDADDHLGRTRRASSTARRCRRPSSTPPPASPAPSPTRRRRAPS